MTRRHLPYGRQSIGDAEIRTAVEALRHDFLTTGPAVDAFEAALSKATGSRFAVACSSGTAALHLAMRAAGMGEGDVVGIPTLTFLATANAARYVGAEVFFTDVDPNSGLMRIIDAEAAIERGVKAMVPVHLAGQCVDMAELGPRSRDKGIAIIEDACHALGGWQRDACGGQSRVGSCKNSDMAVFSFHPVKTVTTAGEGGAVTTNDETLFKAMRLLRNHGMAREPGVWENTDLAFDASGAPNPWYYEMQDIGFNYRITDVQCAVGKVQLGRLDSLVARRREIVARYDELLAGLAPAISTVSRDPTGEPAWHLYPVLVDFESLGRSRADVMNELSTKGIGTQVHYLPVHLQPYYQQRYGVKTLPGAWSYYSRTLSLPLFPEMDDGDVDRVVDGLRGSLGVV